MDHADLMNDVHKSVVGIFGTICKLQLPNDVVFIIKMINGLSGLRPVVISMEDEINHYIFTNYRGPSTRLL